ncbi:protein neuralized [Dendrobium catenatum]|uniref:Protein neuralized n=1 Tax=Dendrobium catenatum TaxID=906689 RepID=A0A2I0WSF6_9ASPA|nr:protein neuralized [Dendrobium catenatum]
MKLASLLLHQAPDPPQHQIFNSSMASSVAQIPPGDLFSPLTADRRIQSQIMDQWATRQAREMITTIERRSHEAELSALSNVRASSLIQMWREMESVAYPRGGGSSLTAEKVSGGSDAESEKQMRVRKMSLKIASWPSSSSDESEFSGTGKEQLENQANIKVVRVRGRKEMEDLVMRMKQERMRELADLADEQKVSRFPFHGRIQVALLSYRDNFSQHCKFRLSLAFFNVIFSD